MKKILYTEKLFKKVEGETFGTQTLLSHIKDEMFVVKCTCGYTRELNIRRIYNKNRRFCTKCKGKWRSKHLIDKKFGKMTILDFDVKTSSEEWKMKCLCDCGELESIRITRIKQLNEALACKKCLESSRDLVGNKIGGCLVVRRINKKPGRRWYECKCKCNNFFHTDTHSLLHKKYSDKCAICRRLSIANGKDFPDHAGKRYGDLKVIKREYRPELDSVIWKCLCVCGDYCYKKSFYLFNAKRASCDYCKNLKRQTQKRKNGCKIRASEIHQSRVGKKFGLLFVKKFMGYLTSENYSTPLFLCKCKCGNQVIRNAITVANSGCRSCGCLHEGNYSLKKINDEEIENIYTFLALKTYTMDDLLKMYDCTKDSIIERLRSYAYKNDLKVLDLTPRRRKNEKKSK